MASHGRTDSQFLAELGSGAERVNAILMRVLDAQEAVEDELRRAMKYTLMAPGKRVRAVLVLWSCELACGRVTANAETAAAAIEMVHTYSLVHDDLPAMDDDDFRRGKPTCHKAFSEATAILTGDALLTLAFEILATGVDDPEVSAALVSELATAAGPAGMIGGQIADLLAENTASTEQALRRIHTNKTAKMFACAAVMGGLCGGADKGQLANLRDYGLKIGLGFQIADDILDICASSEQLGKTAGKDAMVGKATYPSIIGMDRSKELAEKLCNEALAALEPFGRPAQKLANLASALLKRTS